MGLGCLLGVESDLEAGIRPCIVHCGDYYRRMDVPVGLAITHALLCCSRMGGKHGLSQEGTCHQLIPGMQSHPLAVRTGAWQQSAMHRRGGRKSAHSEQSTMMVDAWVHAGSCYLTLYKW